ncbi:MAG: alpha/beta fold hydrolase [Planctomycetota bacterium]
MIRALRQRLLDQFVLRPSRGHMPYAPKERLILSRDGLTDELFVSRPATRFQADASSEADRREVPPELIVFKFPGTAGRAERASDWPCGCLPDVDVEVYTWNGPGYGRTSGRASLSAMAARAAMMFELMIEEVSSTDTKVWLVGNSLGCATAVSVANQFSDRIDGLMMRNPPPLVQTVKRVAHRYPAGRWTDSIAESLPPSMNLMQTATQIRLPTVILQSEYDKLVPPELQMTIYESINAPKQLVVMEGLGHDGVATEAHEQEITVAVTWLWNQALAAS